MNYSKTRFVSYIDYIVQAVINNFLPLFFVMFNTKFGISYAALGFVVLLNFLIQLLVDILSIKIVAKFGTRKCIIASNLFCGTGLVLLGVLPRIIPNTFLAICLATVFTAIGGGFIEVLVSPIVDRISGNMSKRYMSFLHSFYCWGQISVVLLITCAVLVFGHECWSVAAVCWSVVPFFAAAMFFKVPIVEDAPPEERMRVREMFASKTFILFIILMFAGGASELTMAQWASTFAEQGLGLSKFTGDILGPCAFAFFMGVGRIANSLLPERFSIRKVLLLCGILAAFCYLTAALANNSIVAVIACALCGLGVSVMWPGVLTLASGHFKKGGNAMFSLLAMAGDIGCSVGPWFAGIVAGASDLKTALLCSTVFPLTTVCILLFSKYKKIN